MKLPKQWNHWIKKAGLKRTHGKKWGRYVLVGKDRHWRVTNHNEFECSCPLEYFDRWANSAGATYHTIPQTQAEFISVVENLIEQSKDKR